MTLFDRSIPTAEEAEALSGLVKLLAELQLIESPAIEPFAIEPFAIEPFAIEPFAIEPFAIEPSVAVGMEAIAPVPPTEEAVVPVRSILAIEPLDEIAAFEQLQRLLIEPELAEFHFLVESLERKLTQMEHQLYEPTELMNLLLPWMAELLSRKISESQEEVVQAIAPIIDQIIENRVQQDQAAMSAAIAPLIATAISHQSAQSPQEMASAIAPMMGKAIQEQIVLERDAMVDALYPVIGSTIAKYMTEAVQTINQKIESAFSIEGVRRKITARLQGVSEAELILKAAMCCEVQAVFLIHKASGLIISEVQLHEGNQLESDLVAGMLTAIRSFANDCMTQSNPSELNHIDYGSFKILLEVAGYCYLAIVVSGNPPQRFLTTVRQTLEVIVQLYGAEIAAFEGDPATVPAPVPELLVKLGCTDLTQPPRPKSAIALLMAGLGLGAIALAGSYHHQHLHDRLEAETIAALADAPELAIYRLNVEADRQTLHLSGRVPNQRLRQRAAAIAHTVAPSWTIDNQVQAVEVPPDPVLAAAEVDRVARILNQADSRSIAARYENGKVTIEGTVSRAIEVQQVAQAFEQIPGVNSIATALQVVPLRMNVRFYFGVASAEIAPADRAHKLIQIKAFLDRHPNQIFQITGYSNPINGDRETQWLALQRAKAVRDALMKQGISPDRLRLAGLAQYPPTSGLNQPTWFGRYVEIQPIASVSVP